MDAPFIETPKIGDGSQAYSNPVTFTYARREVTMYTVTEWELDMVASLSNSIDLAFLGVSAGAFISLIAVVLTVDFKTATMAGGFIGSTIISATGMVLFGVRTYASYQTAKRKLAEIKREPSNSLHHL